MTLPLPLRILHATNSWVFINPQSASVRHSAVTNRLRSCHPANITTRRQCEMQLKKELHELQKCAV